MRIRVTDQRLGELGKVYRLATTLLDEHAYPALELIVEYHQRWEIEMIYDEIKTHQRRQQKVLRSKTPEGVRQEVYATIPQPHPSASIARGSDCEELQTWQYQSRCAAAW